MFNSNVKECFWSEHDDEENPNVSVVVDHQQAVREGETEGKKNKDDEQG